MFDVLIESNPQTKAQKKALSLFVSIVLHSIVLMVAIIVPLFFTDTLSPQQVVTYLVAPPPPPPPPPMVARAIKVPKVVEQVTGQLTSPVTIPKTVAMIVDEGPPPEVNAGVVGGVPGGVPGGVIGGVMGGVIGGAISAVPVAPPPPPTPRLEAPKVSKEPLRVGGRVKAPRVVRRVDPVYPLLAKQSRTQGAVILEAILTEEGRVADLKLVSGHPLLVQAAMEAARQWQYEPTYLNDTPARVMMNITVLFSLM